MPRGSVPVPSTVLLSEMLHDNVALFDMMLEHHQRPAGRSLSTFRFGGSFW